MLLESSFQATRRKIREIHSNRKVSIQPPPSQMYPHYPDVNMVLAQQGNGASHANGTNNGVVVYSQNTVQHPIQNSVQLKKLAFFEVMGILLKPTLLSTTPNQRVQEGSFTFQLTAQQASDISLNR